MNSLKTLVLAAALLLAGRPGAHAQALTPGAWHNKQCAVVLSYDDAIDVDLDNVVPALDSLKLGAPFT